MSYPTTPFTASTRYGLLPKRKFGYALPYFKFYFHPQKPYSLLESSEVLGQPNGRLVTLAF